MKSLSAELPAAPLPVSALELGFPTIPVSQVAEHESWRKEIHRPLYHIHKWWANRLGSVFRAIVLGALSRPGTDLWSAFYTRHDLAGKVVLDPFMGSGTTLGEALKLGAAAVGCDSNPVSTFMVRQALTRVSEKRLWSAFRQLESIVASEIQHYYRTLDPNTGESIPVLYYFWVKTVLTPAGEELPLFRRYVFAQNAYPRRRPDAQIVCPHCWMVFTDRYDATLVCCPRCGTRYDPQAGPAGGQYVKDPAGRRYRIRDLLPAGGEPPAHRLYAVLALLPTGRKVYLPCTDADLDLYAEATERLRRERLPLPTLALRPGHNTDQAIGYNYRHWRDFFNDRQLLCLGLLLRGILQLPEQDVREQLLCLFSGTLEFNNLFCSYKGEGTGAVRHMFSHHILKPERTPLENSVWGQPQSSGTFSTLFESRLLAAKRYLDEPSEIRFELDLFGERSDPVKSVPSLPVNAPLVADWAELARRPGSALVLNGDSARLPLPDAAVDAVVTDPPYFDFVHYSELSDFFFAWLAPALRNTYPWFDRVDSSDPGEVQQKDPRTFAAQLGAVLRECRRVLKPDGVLAFTFHHSRPSGWAAVHEAVTGAGLRIVAAHLVHGELRAASPKSAAAEPISLDAILVCRPAAAVLPSTTFEPSAAAEARLADLQAAGLALSSADHFVIRASQTLIALGHQAATYDEAVAALGRHLPGTKRSRPSPR